MIGVGIVSFNRPFYLRRVLKSLEAQTDIDNAEFHLLQDGAVNKFSDTRYANEFDIIKCLGLFDRAKLPSKQVHLQKHNMGVSINQREGIDWLAERYERIIIIEDDALISPHWFRLAAVLFDQFEDCPDVFGFTPGFRRMCDGDAAMDNLDYVHVTGQHMWTECFTAGAWHGIQEHMLPYYDLVNHGDYHTRPNVKIRALHKARGVEERASSQDAARVTAIKLTGMVRMQCTVNRGLCIGRNGMNFNNAYYEGLQLGEQIPYAFDSDATRGMFICR